MRAVPQVAHTILTGCGVAVRLHLSCHIRAHLPNWPLLVIRVLNRILMHKEIVVGLSKHLVYCYTAPIFRLILEVRASSSVELRKHSLFFLKAMCDH